MFSFTRQINQRITPKYSLVPLLSIVSIRLLQLVHIDSQVNENHSVIKIREISTDLCFLLFTARSSAILITVL